MYGQKSLAENHESNYARERHSMFTWPIIGGYSDTDNNIYQPSTQQGLISYI